jgi:hypothetical protein
MSIPTIDQTDYIFNENTGISSASSLICSRYNILMSVILTFILHNIFKNQFKININNLLLLRSLSLVGLARHFTKAFGSRLRICVESHVFLAWYSFLLLLNECSF